MTSDHAVHSETHRAVEEYLAELFDDPYQGQEDGHFYVRYGSTILEISVEPYGPDEAVVVVMSYCVQGVAMGEELALGLLSLNHRLPFGAFSVVDRDVYFSYSVFGHNLDPRTLLGAITAVANISDEWDDRLVERFGGQTALDRIRDTGGRRRVDGTRTED